MLQGNGGIIGPANNPTNLIASGVWGLNEQAKAQGAGNWPSSAAYQVERSLRFNSADSAYLSRTPSVAGNQTKWTFSAWIKRSALSGTTQTFFYCDGTSDTTYFWIGFNGSEQLACGNWSAVLLATTQVFRDVSSWYHVSVVLDTSQATATDRIKFYVNGSQVTTFATNNLAAQISQNEQCGINNTVPHNIGRDAYTGGRFYFNGYLTEVNFIDGQALDPTSFGETDSTTGVWKPKAYTGSYGTNGFYLKFADNSGTTATTLGKDSSGNGNNWTPNNFSVTPGAGNDSLVDSPTPYGTDTGVGGEVRGNYATLNPLNKNSPISFANGSLDFTGTSGEGRGFSTISMKSGKWYCEFTSTSTALYNHPGIYADSISLTADTNRIIWRQDGPVYRDGTQIATITSFTNGDVIGMTFDADTRALTFYKNGVLAGGPYTATDPGAGNGFYYHILTGGLSGCSGSFNFGQRPFAYTAPSGFKALCTTNLPDPTVVDGSSYFNTVLYTGTGSSQSITGVGFQPDWVWIKERSGAADHGLYDAVRGVQQQLESNTTTAETTESTGLTAFGSDGFTVGSLAQLNTNTDTYVAWNWNAGGSNATNTDGTITSTVRANPTAGFSIVTFTAPASGSATVGHGLGVAPSMMIWKSRSNADNWTTYHSSLGNNVVFLNLTNAASSITWGTINSTIFTADTAQNVTANRTYVAYCFAAVPGFSAFGSYTGNGSADGPFIYTGFRPAFLIYKRTDAADTFGWIMTDDNRDAFNAAKLYLGANTSAVEGTASGNALLDYLSNGFKFRFAGPDGNVSGGTYIYAAFAENPFKYSLAR